VNISYRSENRFVITHIVITYRFDIKNIDLVANTASDDVCNCVAIVAMLNELILCRDGMLCLSDDSFSSNDVEQLIYFYAPAIMTSLHYYTFYQFFLF